MHLVHIAPCDRMAAPALPVRKTLQVVNDFVVSTAQFLNRFSTSCEVRLDRLAHRLARLESELVLLEKKLESIPGLEAGGEAAPPASTLPMNVPDVGPAPGAGAGATHCGRASGRVRHDARPSPAVPAAAGPPAMKVSEDPEYERYFKVRGRRAGGNTALRRPLIVPLSGLAAAPPWHARGSREAQDAIRGLRSVLA